MYQNMVLAESGKTAAALTHLERNESDICDELSILEMKGNLPRKLTTTAVLESCYNCRVPLFVPSRYPTDAAEPPFRRGRHLRAVVIKKPRQQGVLN